MPRCKRRELDQRGDHDQGGEGEEGGDGEGHVEPVDERRRGADALLPSCERPAAASRTVTRTARPSAAPTCCMTLTRPEAAPASCGSTPASDGRGERHQRGARAQAEQDQADHDSGRRRRRRAAGSRGAGRRWPGRCPTASATLGRIRLARTLLTSWEDTNTEIGYREEAEARPAGASSPPRPGGTARGRRTSRTCRRTSARGTRWRWCASALAKRRSGRIGSSARRLDLDEERQQDHSRRRVRPRSTGLVHPSVPASTRPRTTLAMPIVDVRAPARSKWP